MKPTNRGMAVIPAMLIGALGATLLCFGGWWLSSYVRARVALTTPYQAVLLSNGSAYFGKLHDLGTPFPVLTDVYYVQSHEDPQTKQVTSVLVRRGKEWHGPDRMILNANMIVLVEPVNPSSRVAQLIRQDRSY